MAGDLTPKPVSFTHRIPVKEIEARRQEGPAGFMAHMDEILRKDRAEMEADWRKSDDEFLERCRSQARKPRPWYLRLRDFFCPRRPKIPL